MDEIAPTSPTTMVLTVIGGAVLLVIAIVVTTRFLPDRASLVLDSVTVPGMVTTDPVSRSCGESTCYSATVRYTTESGDTYARRMSVGRDARPGDTTEVRYSADDPTIASTDSSVKALWLLAFTVMIGPIMLVSILAASARRLWRYLRSVGEAH